MTPERSDFPPVPEEAVVKPEEERPIKRALKPEEVESKDEREYDKMKTVDYDMDGDDNPDFDPAL
jgi:hypothetical protein